MVCFPQTVSHDLGQFFSNVKGFISCGFVGSREIHSDHDAFIRGQRLFKSMHFLLSAILIIMLIICIFISFDTVNVISLFMLLYFYDASCSLGHMSMFLVGICDEGFRGQSICLQNLLS